MYLVQRSVRKGEIKVLDIFYSWDTIFYCKSTIAVRQYLKLKTHLQESRWTPPLQKYMQHWMYSCHKSFRLSVVCPGVWLRVPSSGWNRELQVRWVWWVTFIIQMKADECSQSFKVHDALGCNFPGLVISYLMCFLYTFSTRYRLSIFCRWEEKSLVHKKSQWFRWLAERNKERVSSKRQYVIFTLVSNPV